MDENLGRVTKTTPSIPIENAFRLMADAAPVMIWVAGTDKLCHYFNAGWLQFTGRTPDEEYGNGWADGIHPLDLHRCLDIYIRSFDARTPFKMEYRLRDHTGAYRWVLNNGVPRYNDENEFIGYVGSCTDINDIVELEERKDEFINAASHELKTPLTTLSVYLHILKELFPPEEYQQVHLYLNKIGSQVGKMTKLIADLLDLSKIQSGILPAESERIHVLSVWQEIVDNYQLITPTHQISLKNSGDFWIYGDKDRLGQVLTNLLSNAVKYSPHNSTIEVAVDARDGRLLTTVRDHGIGIDKIHHRRLFERFYRVIEEQQQTFPGLGIGLYICAQIIKQHDGAIWLDSEPGKGSLFCFSLPIYPEHE